MLAQKGQDQSEISPSRSGQVGRRATVLSGQRLIWRNTLVNSEFEHLELLGPFWAVFSCNFVLVQAFLKKPLWTLTDRFGPEKARYRIEAENGLSVYSRASLTPQAKNG